MGHRPEKKPCLYSHGRDSHLSPLAAGGDGRAPDAKLGRNLTRSVEHVPAVAWGGAVCLRIPLFACQLGPPPSLYCRGPLGDWSCTILTAIALLGVWHSAPSAAPASTPQPRSESLLPPGVSRSCWLRAVIRSRSKVVKRTTARRGEKMTKLAPPLYRPRRPAVRKVRCTTSVGAAASVERRGADLKLKLRFDVLERKGGEVLERARNGGGGDGEALVLGGHVVTHL